MIIDAKNLIVGRIGTVACKKALLGEKVSIINSDKAVLTGRKRQIIERWQQRRSRGQPTQGPFITRRADLLFKRMIRGMLPYKQEKGRQALSRIKCYLGVPEEFEGKPTEIIKEASIEKLPNLKYITVQELCKELGKWQK